MDKYQVLKEYFGYEQFRPFQEESIDALLDGRDLLTILPTGAGKSLCYQLPTLMSDGLSVVVSPLIALMQDQVRNLQVSGIEAVTIHSDLSEAERNDIFGKLHGGRVKLLYVAPERLILPSFIDFLKKLHVNFFVIDEAHCVSEWGHEFRSDYQQLALLKEHFPDIPIAAFTATATREVAVDIAKSLRLNDPLILRGNVFRENLHVSCMPRHQNGRSQVLDFLKDHRDESGIIYTFTRKECEDLARFLQSHNISAKAYHARLEKEEKQRVYEDFVHDRIDIVVATIAFGMGIDKSNIRFVLHTSLPKTLESYYQEIGRAGRDGLPSHTLLLFNKSDEIQKRELIQNTPNEHYREILEGKLSKMYRYAVGSGCRHRVMGQYFGDEVEACGDKCDNCQREPAQMEDITREVRMFLSAVYRTGSRFGQNHLIDLLRGSKSAKIAQFDHDKLSVYGIGTERSKQVWQRIIDRLFDIEAITTGEHRAIVMREKGVQILKGAQKVGIDATHLVDPKRSSNLKLEIERDTPKDEKFEALRELRARLAKAANLPAYIIFSDKTLLELASYLPKNKAEMLAINGIGEVKYERYGEPFLELCLKLRSEG